MHINFFITPSCLQQFYLKPQWGLESLLKTLYPNKYPSQCNYFTETGNKIHNQLKYNNNKRFYTVFSVEYAGKTFNVAMEGTPDHLNPLKELKTVSYYKLASKVQKKRLIEAASLQLQAYMLMCNEDTGYVVLYCREGIIDEMSYVVHRDDKRVKDYICKFIDYCSFQDEKIRKMLFADIYD